MVGRSPQHENCVKGFIIREFDIVSKETMDLVGKNKKNCSQTLKLVVVVFGREPATQKYSALCMTVFKPLHQKEPCLLFARLTVVS